MTRTYGNSTPAFSLAVASGSFGYSDGLSDLGTASYGFDHAGDGVHVGSYPINVSGLGNADYDISYAAGVNRGELIGRAALRRRCASLEEHLGLAKVDASHCRRLAPTERVTEAETRSVKVDRCREIADAQRCMILFDVDVWHGGGSHGSLSVRTCWVAA